MYVCTHGDTNDNSATTMFKDHVIATAIIKNIILLNKKLHTNLTQSILCIRPFNFWTILLLATIEPLLVLQLLAFHLLIQNNIEFRKNVESVLISTQNSSAKN